MKNLRTAEAAAPGKLYIAGEYAVVDPGHPSIVIAVDRFLSACVEETTGAGTIRSRQYGNRPIQWQRAGSRLVLDEPNEALRYVLAAIHVTEQWLEENDIPLAVYHLTINSELNSAAGQKYGLGSSGAVTVAVVRALLRFYQKEASGEAVYKLSALAHLSLGSNGSFGDLAASSYTGWVAYSSFDRETVRQWMQTLSVSELISRHWPSLSIEQLAAPENLALLIGWTGSPASTTHLVDKVKAKQTDATVSYDHFLQESAACVRRMIAAFREDDVPEIQKEIRQNRLLLNQLKKITGVVIETPSLAQLCETAEKHGGAAKSSGAGGGDCGIALFDRSTNLTPVLNEWETHNISALPLRVHQKDDALT